MQRVLMPALRAAMGDWVYYVATMSMDELALRVDFAQEVHPSKALNELIQRRLTHKRAEQIADAGNRPRARSRIWLLPFSAVSPLRMTARGCRSLVA